MQIVLRRKGDGMECEIELSPALADGLKYGFELDFLAHVAGQEDRRLKLLRQRLHIALRLVVGIGNGELGTEHTECLRP